MEEAQIIVKEGPYGCAIAVWYEGELIAIISPPDAHGKMKYIHKQLAEILSSHLVENVKLPMDYKRQFEFWQEKIEIPFIKDEDFTDECELTWVTMWD